MAPAQSGLCLRRGRGGPAPGRALPKLGAAAATGRPRARLHKQHPTTRRCGHPAPPSPLTPNTPRPGPLTPAPPAQGPPARFESRTRTPAFYSPGPGRSLRLLQPRIPLPGPGTVPCLTPGSSSPSVGPAARLPLPGPISCRDPGAPARDRPLLLPRCPPVFHLPGGSRGTRWTVDAAKAG